MSTELSPEDTNILRQQGRLFEIADELKRDIITFDKNRELLRDELEAINIKWELSETERFEISKRMNQLDRMISEVRK
jgi:hypothetical protein